MSVRLTRELRAEGLGSSAIRRRVREESLYRLRRGGFATELDEGASRHLQLILATVPRLAPGTALSHESAAVVHGLPVDARRMQLVTVTRSGTGGGRVGPYVHRYCAPLATGDVEEVDGLVLTVTARTLVDLARCGELSRAVAAGDAALRTGEVTVDQLSAQVAAASRRRGLAAARVMIGLLDGRSESPGESLSRVTIWQLGLPAPELQYVNVIDSNEYRSDFAWIDRRVLGEFDGKVKYGELLRPGESAGDVVMREKRRDADLRSAGWEVAHWTWGDVLHPDRLNRLLRAVLRLP